MKSHTASDDACNPSHLNVYFSVWHQAFPMTFSSLECSLCFIFITAVQKRQQNYTLWPVKWSVFFWKWMLNTQLYCWLYELNLSDRILFIWLWKWTQVKPASITMLYCTWITLLDSVSLYLILLVSRPQLAHTHIHTPRNAQEGPASMNTVV